MIGGRQPSQQEVMEQQQQQERHMQLQAQAPEGVPSSGIDDYMQMIRSDMDPDTLRILDMLLTKDFALGNLSEADIHELKWLREITKLKLDAIHPSESTAMKGKKRELVYTKNGSADGEALPLEPLSEYERLRVDEIIRVAHLIVSRSKGGFQWDQIAKSYSVSEIRDRDEDDGGWLSF